MAIVLNQVPVLSLWSSYDNLTMEPYKNFRKYSGTSPGNYPNGNWVSKYDQYRF